MFNSPASLQLRLLRVPGAAGELDGAKFSPGRTGSGGFRAVGYFESKKPTTGSRPALTLPPKAGNLP
jgi:hypothetical protein